MRFHTVHGVLKARILKWFAILFSSGSQATGRSYPTPLSPRPKAAAGRSNPTTEARGSGQEDKRLIQGAVAAQAQEGLEELSHVEGQEGRR